MKLLVTDNLISNLNQLDILDVSLEKISIKDVPNQAQSLFENDKFKSIKLLDNELSYIPEGRVASSLNKLGDSLILQGGWSPSTKETFKNTVIFSL